MSYNASFSGSEESEENSEVSLYLVVFLLVTVISTLVILLGVKPDENGFSFLCVKDENGKCQVSMVRVVGLSLLLGALVAASVYGVNKAKPGVLKM
jgi:hypothetical protein